MPCTVLVACKVKVNINHMISLPLGSALCLFDLPDLMRARSYSQIQF